MKPETMMIDDVKDVKESSVKSEVINFTGEESLAAIMVGKKVLVRTRNEGVNAGIVVLADETGVILTSCRRLYYHQPIDKATSWYEGVAKTGISKESKVSCTIDRKVIIEDYSMTECTDEAFNTIMELAPNEQS